MNAAPNREKINPLHIIYNQQKSLFNSKGLGEIGNGDNKYKQLSFIKTETLTGI